MDYEAIFRLRFSADTDPDDACSVAEELKEDAELLSLEVIGGDVIDFRLEDR